MIPYDFRQGHLVAIGTTRHDAEDVTSVMKEVRDARH